MTLHQQGRLGCPNMGGGVPSLLVRTPRLECTAVYVTGWGVGVFQNKAASGKAVLVSC